MNLLSVKYVRDWFDLRVRLCAAGLHVWESDGGVRRCTACFVCKRVRRRKV